MEEEYFMWLSGAEERIEKINLALQLEDTCSNMIFLNINDQFSCKIISTKQIIVPNDGDKCFILWNVVIKGGDEEICADLRTQINETVQTLTQINQLNVILDKLLEFMEYHYEIEGNYSFEDTMNDDPIPEEVKEITKDLIQKEIAEEAGILNPSRHHEHHVEYFQKSSVHESAKEAIEMLPHILDMREIAEIIIYPEIECVKLRMDVGFLNLNVAIIEYLGLTLDDTLNIIIEQTLTAFGDEVLSVADLAQKAALKFEVNQLGSSDSYACEIMTRLVKNYFGHYSKYAKSIIQPQNPKKFLNVVYLKCLTDVGIEESLAASALILSNNNLEQSLTKLRKDVKNDFLPQLQPKLSLPSTQIGNIFVNLLNYLREMLESISDHCIICLKRHSVNSSLRIRCCQNPFCQFNFEECEGYKIYHEIKNHSELVNLELSMASNAIISGRSSTVLEPFPTFCLLYREMREKAGYLSNRQKVDDKNKNMKLVKQIMNQMPKIEDMLMHTLNEQELKEYLKIHFDDDENGCVAYKLITYVIATNRLQFTFLNNKKDLIPGIPDNLKQIIVTSQDPELEEHFQKEKKKHGSVWLFHGSPADSWYSIIRNGLQALNKTPLQTTDYGFHGTGIYASCQMGTSYGYAARETVNPAEQGAYTPMGLKTGGNNWKGAKFGSNQFTYMAIIEVINISKYMVHPDWMEATIPHSKNVIIRYLLLFPKTNSGHAYQQNWNAQSTKIKLQDHYYPMLAKMKHEQRMSIATRINLAQAMRKSGGGMSQPIKPQVVVKPPKIANKREEFKNDINLKEINDLAAFFAEGMNQVKLDAKGLDIVEIFTLDQLYNILVKAHELKHSIITKINALLWEFEFPAAKYITNKQLANDFQLLLKPIEKKIRINLIFGADFPKTPPRMKLVYPKLEDPFEYLTIEGDIIPECLTLQSTRIYIYMNSQSSALPNSHINHSKSHFLSIIQSSSWLQLSFPSFRVLTQS